ncbi:MAG: acyl-CoA dehydrogenase family protein, partial [Shinella sp.]
GYARDYVKTVARPVGDGYRIEGTKAFSLGADTADRLIVSARIGTADGPVGLFLLARAADGVSLKIAPALDARLGAEVRLAVQVPTSSLLGNAQDDRIALIDHLIDRGAIAACAEACGAMAEATQATIEYLKVREQFGQPLSKFQVLQHRLVDMSLACEEARAIVHAALEALDNGGASAQRAVWHAKVQTAQSARFVGTQCLQLHGGIGMTDELKAGHLYKRLCVCEAMFGDADWYLKQLSLTLPDDAAARPDVRAEACAAA